MVLLFFCFVLEGIISYLLQFKYTIGACYCTRLDWDKRKWSLDRDHLCPDLSSVIYTKRDRLCPRYLGVMFSTPVGPSVPKIFRGDFFLRVGPFLPEIFRGDFFTRVGPLVPEIFRG